MKYSVRRTLRGAQVEALVAHDIIAHEHDVAEHGEQQFANSANHLAVHKRMRGCSGKRYFQATILVQEGHIEITVALKHRTRIIGLDARIQYSQDAAPQQWVEAAFVTGSQQVDFNLREDLETTLWPHLGIDGVDSGGCHVHRISPFRDECRLACFCLS